MVLNGKSNQNGWFRQWFRGTPISGNPHISLESFLEKNLISAAAHHSQLCPHIDHRFRSSVWFFRSVFVAIRSICLGKLHYFTNLNCWAIKGDDFPYNHQYCSEGEQWGRYNLPRFVWSISAVVHLNMLVDNESPHCCCYFAGNIFGNHGPVETL